MAFVVEQELGIVERALEPPSAPTWFASDLPLCAEQSSFSNACVYNSWDTGAMTRQNELQ